MILDRILADKRVEVEERKGREALDSVRSRALDAPPSRDFAGALCQVSALSGQSEIRNPKSEIRMIAEVKKASPSKGLIRADFDPVGIARTYEAAGASAISVLTDEKYFQGKLEYLEAIRREVSPPLLRKDFVVDAYQIYEARAAGADAVLLIVAALSDGELLEFRQVAEGLGMAALVEVHTAEEMDRALDSGARIVGINNRNLQTFDVSLETSLELAKMVPDDRILVSESGIFSRTDVVVLMRAGVNAILVGESLMRETDPGVRVRELLGTPQVVDRNMLQVEGN